MTATHVQEAAHLANGCQVLPWDPVASLHGWAGHPAWLLPLGWLACPSVAPSVQWAQCRALRGGLWCEGEHGALEQEQDTHPGGGVSLLGPPPALPSELCPARARQRAIAQWIILLVCC